MLCVKEYQFTWIGNASKGDCDEVGDDEDDGDDLYITRSLGALRAPTSSLRPFGPP